MFNRKPVLVTTLPGDNGACSPETYGTFHPDTTVPTDLRAVCLWSALGLAVTGLFFAMGFSAEIGQALMAAG
jgi:hypothetical protein